MNKVVISNNFSHTEEIAGLIGSKLRGQEVIELVADLGGGKTTFVRGLVRGAKSTDHVSSPSFTISNEYYGDNVEILHFDFYRLNEPGIIKNILAEKIGTPGSVVVTEWGEIVADVLPIDRLSITFKVLGEDKRELDFSYPLSLAYLVEGL